MCRFLYKLHFKGLSFHSIFSELYPRYSDTPVGLHLKCLTKDGIQRQGLVKFCSIEFTDNPVSTLRVVAGVRAQPLGAADPHSTANRSDITGRSDNCWLVSLRFGHGDVTCGDLPKYDAVQICTHKKQNASVPNAESHKTAALLRVLPTYSVCSQQSYKVWPTQRVLTAVLIMFCPHTLCAHSSPNNVFPPTVWSEQT
jgi:hypothetical protein